MERIEKEKMLFSSFEYHIKEKETYNHFEQQEYPNFPQIKQSMINTTTLLP